MFDRTTRDKVLSPVTLLDGRQGWLIGGRFIARIGGGEDDPTPGGDPKPADQKPDPDDFDKARALDTIRKQREENRQLQDKVKDAEALRKRLQEIEDKDKTEVERLAGSVKEASEKLTVAEQRAADLALQMTVERAARKLNFIDEDDAFRLIDRKAVETDDDGNPTNVEKLLTDLAKAKPHLVKAEGQTPPAGTGTRAVPNTPKPANNGSQTREQDVDTKAKVLQQSGAYPRF